MSSSTELGMSMLVNTYSTQPHKAKPVYMRSNLTELYHYRTRVRALCGINTMFTRHVLSEVWLCSTASY